MIKCATKWALAKDGLRNLYDYTNLKAPGMDEGHYFLPKEQVKLIPSAIHSHTSLMFRI